MNEMTDIEKLRRYNSKQTDSRKVIEEPVDGQCVFLHIIKHFGDGGRCCNIRGTDDVPCDCHETCQFYEAYSTCPLDDNHRIPVVKYF